MKKWRTQGNDNIVLHSASAFPKYRYTKTFRHANRPATTTIETDRLLLLSYIDMSERAAFVLRNHNYCCVFGMKMPLSLDVWNEMIFLKILK